jgi:hypothetical protein
MVVAARCMMLNVANPATITKADTKPGSCGRHRAWRKVCPKQTDNTEITNTAHTREMVSVPAPIPTGINKAHAKPILSIMILFISDLENMVNPGDLNFGQDVASCKIFFQFVAE